MFWANAKVFDYEFAKKGLGKERKERNFSISSPIVLRLFFHFLESWRIWRIVKKGHKSHKQELWRELNGIVGRYVGFGRPCQRSYGDSIDLISIFSFLRMVYKPS